MEKPRLALTHAGHFHADDVFSAALLREIWPDLEIRRVFEVPNGFDGLAFDIGGGPFDHHGPDRQCRENGLPYAAFGLLWREFGEGLVGAEQAKWIDEHFIQPLDKDDNFGTGDSLADAIGGFNPVWDSTADADARFWQAEAFAAQILKNRLEGARAVNRAGAVVDKALSRMKDGIVVLPRFAPWKNRLRQSEAKLVVYPSQRGGFNAQGVPIPDDPQHRLRCSFPERWRGLRAPQLERVSGIHGLRFCHVSGFLVSTNTLDAALSACRAALAEAADPKAKESDQK